MESHVDKGQTEVVLLGHEDRELVVSLDGWELIEVAVTENGPLTVYLKT